MWRKIIKVALIVVVAAFVIAQFIRPDFSNPPIVPSETLTSTTAVPAEVERLLARSCNDCHSNETRYPWYSKISPFSWLLADHIEEGRREMNFSVWSTYTREKKLHKLEEICEQVDLGYMPLPSYLWIHRESVLSKADSDLLCTWTKAETDRLPL